MDVLRWLYELRLSYWVRESLWGHPAMLCFHALGMALVVGIVLVLSIRVLTGWPKEISPAAFDGLLRVARWGFFANFVSGFILFISNAPSLTLNWTFQAKIALIAAGGVSVLALWRMVGASPEEALAGGALPAKARGVAALNILFWLGAIVFGRYIAYTLQFVL